MRQYDIIQELISAYPNQTRHTCFGCRRYNSLAIYRNDGQIQWTCFGNGCNIRGRQQQHLTIADIQTRRIRKLEEQEKFILPDYLVSGLNREAVRHYLQSVHCLEAAIEGRIQVRYDPKQNRCVFLIYNDDVLVNATGRALAKGTIPKWHIYGHERYPLICGNKDHAVIVEDAASAIRISKWLTGIAILGTDFSLTNISKIKKYKKLMISLDKDALRKVLKMQKELEYFADVTIGLLDEDLKNLDDAHCVEFLGKHFNLEDVEDL